MNRLKIDFLEHSYTLAATNTVLGQINPRDISEGRIPRFKV